MIRWHIFVSSRRIEDCLYMPLHFRVSAGDVFSDPVALEKRVNELSLLWWSVAVIAESNLENEIEAGWIDERPPLRGLAY